MHDAERKELLKLCPNGDIYVKGKLIENDLEVVGALREFLKLDNWTKIESEADLPKEENKEYFVFIDGKVKTGWFSKSFTGKQWLKNVSHYMPIIKPAPPK